MGRVGITNLNRAGEFGMVGELKGFGDCLL